MIANDSLMKALLERYRRIGVVGLSPKEQRPSNRVARYMIAAGYEIVPVNPGQESILAKPCYPDLLSVPSPIEIVNVFRQSKEVPQIVDQAISIGAKVLWLQLGIVHEEAMKKARLHGIEVVADQCIKIVHERLFPSVHEL